jgi:NAD(P)-dependent dehydrogenase (short-subunit alcohol dehydrogenase family)
VLIDRLLFVVTVYEMENKMLLKNQVILVTGAGQGIAQSIALTAAQEGARVCVTDRKLESLGETESLLKAQGADYLSLEMYVTRDDQITNVMGKTTAHFGALNGLVNNAGVFLPEPSLEMTKKNIQQQFSVNVIGVLMSCQAAARIMMAQDSGGRIVNIASNAGKVGFPGYVAYSASKAAVINLTQTLAKEWAPYSINVNAVCPGGVDTPMLRSVSEHIAGKTGEEAEEIFQRLLPPQLGRHVQPYEIGQVVAFLLSDQAQIIRGQSISIDGGETPY